MRKKIAISFLIAALIVPVVNAEWWDHSWNYRIPVEIHSSNSLTDYQVKLIIDTQSLISADKVIWVKVPEITSSTTIYMYYDNSDVESASDGEKTFLFFDDFNSLDRWELEQSCTIAGNCEIVTYEEKSCLQMRGGISKIVHSLAGMPATGYGVKTLSKIEIPDNRYNYWGEFMPFFGFGSGDKVDNEDNAYQFGYNIYFSGPFVTYYQGNIRVFYEGQEKAGSKWG